MIINQIRNYFIIFFFLISYLLFSISSHLKSVQMFSILSPSCIILQSIAEAAVLFSFLGMESLPKSPFKLILKPKQRDCESNNSLDERNPQRFSTARSWKYLPWIKFRWVQVLKSDWTDWFQCIFVASSLKVWFSGVWSNRFSPGWLPGIRTSELWMGKY